MLSFYPPVEAWPHVTPSDWSTWQWQLKNSLSSAAEFESVIELTQSERLALAESGGFKVQTTPYYLSLVNPAVPNDPVRRFILPQHHEMQTEGQQIPDPLGELKHSPHTRLVHRYPDRVLFLVTDQCAVYCRHCLRKHFTGHDQAFIGSNDYSKALDYIRKGRGIREVILSGGDPLSLSDTRLGRVLEDLRTIEHIDVIRIASRMPVVCPMRITTELAQLLRKHRPVFFMTHFNHPQELTRESAAALERLVESGVPVMNQMVLLNGINNHEALVYALSRRLLRLSVKPYYMFQCDPSMGTAHFRTSIAESKRIQKELWGRASGLAVPQYSIDIPGGGGKIGAVPSFAESGGLSENPDKKTSDPSDETLESGDKSQHVASTVRLTGFDGVSGEYEEATEQSRIEPYLAEEYLDEWQSVIEQTYGR